MGKMLNIVTPSHSATKRDCLARMAAPAPYDKVHCMQVAEQYGQDYWDGDRRYAYGGYKYIPGRQTPIAQALIKKYGLTSHSSVLDIGCGKGFLLYEFTQLVPGINVVGLDASRYAIENAHPEIKSRLLLGHAESRLPFGDEQFDLIISINTLHNLHLHELPTALREIQRVGYNNYICVESYRDRQEQFNLQCWALTCNTFMNVASWIWFYEQHEYSGDYEFVYF